MGNDQAKAGGVTPAGIQSMDESLQKKFSKGIQFNMKIILRGDRNTGKTCLFHRMEGKPFLESYIPTNEIQVTSILWSYKVTNDTVKVEVWDIVDKGRVQKKESKGLLKIFNDPKVEDEEDEERKEKVLDASFLDVYKGCHGVVLMFDMTKIWTWKYIERELPKVPFHIPVIILGNFRDLGEHRAIVKDEVIAFVESLNRPDGAAEVMYAESSMKNGFGLMHLHKFLSIPFLQLQQEMLLQQLQVNREQMLVAQDELTNAASSEDQNYSMFTAHLQRAAEERRRKARAQQEALEDSDTYTAPRRRNTMDSEQDSIQPSSPAPPPETPPTAQQPESHGSGKAGSKLASRFSGFLSKSKEKKSEAKSPVPVPSRSGTRSQDIDNFVPEGDVDSFLGEEEVDEGEEESEEEESSEEEEEGNPDVAADEDLSSPEDDTPPFPTKPEPVKPAKPVRPPLQLKSAKEIDLTESEEEEKTIPSPRRTADKDLALFWGDSGQGGGRGGGGKVGEDAAGKGKQKSKTKGLLLDWTVEESPKPKKKGSVEPSPDLSEGRKERRKKKEKSKRSKHREKEAEVATENGPPARAPPSGDPFGLTSSLDAWLNAGDVLQPTPHSMGVEKGEEEGVEEEEPRKKSKKHHHHHRRHSERSSSESSRKKKHRSRHTKDAEHSGEYNLV